MQPSEVTCVSWAHHLGSLICHGSSGQFSAHLRQNICFDAHVDGDEGGALLVALPEQRLRLGQGLLLHQVLKGVPSCCIGHNGLHQEQAH